MFPYPSGTAMHVWHASNFLVTEIMARYHRMCGDQVVFPIGYDSFWLPTENFAIKNNKSAHQATEDNIVYFEEQLKGIDFSFDEDRTFKTSDPEYYKWTQWIFTKLYQHNLVYRKDWLVNWCNGCQTVLANDQVVDGRCERCETEIIQKKHPQWYIKITDYADQLLDYSDCDRPEETKIHQTNWIGKSTWCEADFEIASPLVIETPFEIDVPLIKEELKGDVEKQKITVFTTRIDTIYWVTAIVIAPENNIIDQYMTDEKKSELANYRKTTALKTNIERQSTDKDKTWFDSGVQVIHPLTGDLVPVWFADYVLPDYATGAVMFVPAHDERDDEFSGKYNIWVKVVIVSEKWQDTNEFCYTWTGFLINSAQFNWLDNITAKSEITKHLESIGKGKAKITYRLRDWSVSRQRYWGSPIPVYYTFEDNDDGRYTANNPHPDKTKWIPHLIPESDLPVILPLDLPNYKPAGKSPLEDHPSFKYYHAPDGQIYLRECDTLDTFMCSSFYFLRFCDPHNPDQLISPEAAKMMPVDLYVWGKEHTVGHLLYSRFIYKFLKDIGAVACDSKEPFRKLVHQGMVHASDGRKMSKRRGNVIDPMGIINEYGSDTLRTYTMFMWPVEASKNWNPDAVAWVYRFIGRVAKLKEKIAVSALFDKEGAEWSEAGDFESSVSSLDSFFAKGAPSEILSTLHQTIKWVTEDITALKFNTAVSKLMIMTNAFSEQNTIDESDYLIFLKLCAPFATHMTQQIWSELGQEGSIHDSGWPVWDDALIATWSIDLPIQVNGKMRGTIAVASGAAQDEVITLARSHDTIAKWLEWEIVKIIYVQDKICNIIVK
jgi:leucyl-tRNA synthetase